MNFFKSKKQQQDRVLTSRDGPPSSTGSRAQDSKSRATPTESMTSVDNDGSAGSPDHRRTASLDPTPQPSDLPLRNGPAATPNPNAASPIANPNANLYPWSQRRLQYTTSHPSPFPRYGAAVNSLASKEGDIYVMGGLINSSTVKGDLWMIEAGGSLACYPLATTAEGPGPRVGHASLLVGNAFIVFGGDTKIDETDVLDETLYLLNTSTRQWSRSLPAGVRPSGRYGHSLNILGSKIFIFGGQVEGYFMNDLAAFDLNQLQMPNNKWEMLIQNSDSGGPASGTLVPQARTNHTVITYNDKLFLFGGTNGYQWFNDVWCYDPATNKWSQFDCIGYIPVPREGHAAAIVDDVMYIFGGRTEEGVDLGDLAAFRISSRRWYTFQNMGPSPSPRSGHSMTTVNKLVMVVGGEPSSAASGINDLGILYVLDTSKIRYPNDAQITAAAAANRLTQGRRPSVNEGQQAGPMQAVTRNLPSRDGSNPPDPRKVIAAREGGVSSPTNSFRMNGGTNGDVAARAVTGSSPPSGPVPQGPTPSKPPVSLTNSTLTRVRSSSADREAPAVGGSPKAGQSPIAKDISKEAELGQVNGRRTPTQPTVKPVVVPPAEPVKPKTTRQTRGQGSVDSSTEPALRAITTRPSSPPPPTKQPVNPLTRRSSGRNSQTVALLKELDSARNRNAWYASELELARKAGYAPNSTLSPVLESRGAETFDDEDKPLIEALLAMRSELANVQSAVDKQAVLAAKQIAEAEKQRDAAIQEAVYAKAKLAAHMGGSVTGSPQLDRDQDSDSGERSSGMSRKLATALGAQRDLQTRVETMRSDLESEMRARQLADDTANASQRRMAELETYKQQTSTEVERLRAELHKAQREAREKTVNTADAVAALQLLKVERDELQGKYNATVGSSRDNTETFESLRAAVASSEDMKTHLQRRLDEERGLRESIESKHNKLKADHEARTAELLSATQRLKNAEELADKHAKEAKAHRQAVLSGLDKISTARDSDKTSQSNSDRIIALQGQLNAANALVKKHQQEADAAADKLRTAEERIAGLEVYQEQASREGVMIRKQLQAALKEIQTTQAQNSDLRHQLADQQLETNAMTVQHNTLKDILNERGISPTSGERSRGLSSPGSANSPNRMRDLEQQLAEAHAAHEHTRQTFASQTQESETAYREKLSQLENDYQSAVHYVKGTEKMLKQLKDQLARYKTENSRLKAEVDELEETSKAGTSASSDWEIERGGLHKRIESLQEEVRGSAAQLDKQLALLRKELDEVRRERDSAARSSEDAARKLTMQRRDLEEMQQENAVLERRAQDAEQKVSLLLDQVETSVDNYRRRSRQVPSMGSEAGGANGLAGALGHARQESSEAESVYGPGGGGDGRNSTALDNLANELETLRTHWEATNKNYRLSNAFDFENGAGGGVGGGGVGGGGGGGLASRREEDPAGGLGLSESLADWRKRLDADEHSQERTKGKTRPQ